MELDDEGRGIKVEKQRKAEKMVSVRAGSVLFAPRLWFSYVVFPGHLREYGEACPCFPMKFKETL